MPARVVVSEYVDVAHAFVDGEETGMVNAVLDQIARQFRADEFLRLVGRRLSRLTSGLESTVRKPGIRPRISLIARYFRPLATDPGAFGLGDDAAILAHRATRSW